MVDHVDGNPLNNRRSNLRFCTHAQNMKNRKVHRSNKLGVKGVHLAGKRYRAEIKVDGQRYGLGSFLTLAEAAAAYKTASARFHGEFARAA
jgi:hypothetical protein